MQRMQEIIKLRCLSLFWGVFTVIRKGQPPITLYLIVKVFLLNPSGPAKSAFQKTNNKQAEITTFLHENNQPSYADYLRYSRYLHQMKIKLKMMAWLVHVQVIRWWRYFFDVSSKGHT